MSSKKEHSVIARSPYAQKVGFTCGAFDLIHPGHIMMLQEAKTVCDWLVVGVQSDPSMDRSWKQKPIQTHKERITMVGSIKYVNEVVLYDTEADLLKLLKDLAPDIRIVGSDHKGKSFTGDDLSIEVYFNTRDHNWSTTELRRRVYEFERGISRGGR